MGSKWRTPETVPRDGTDIIGAVVELDGTRHVWPVYFGEEDGVFCRFDGAIIRGQLIRWQPLPTFPTYDKEER